MPTALAALGSNLGDRAATLEAAVDQLGATGGVKLVAVSHWHETLPVGGPTGQQPFLNGAVLLDTTLSPAELWQVFQQVEQAAGRQREVTWGPRTLDVDLLLYDHLVQQTPELTIPHPRMMFRRFVMEPAAEIAPELVHPLLGWRLEKIKHHLALARNYIAFFAPPGYSAAELIEQIHTEIASRLIRDKRSVNDRKDFECNTESCLQEIERQASLVSRTRCGEAGIASDELLLSDFWLGQSTVAAKACLPEPDAHFVQQAWQQAEPGTLCPKLVVCLTAGENKPARLSALKNAPVSFPPGSPPCGIPLNSEQLDRWQAAAFELLASGCGGPWMMLDIANPTVALTEVTAAALAMR